ncbi:hypothetical protein ACFVZD_47110 [Streptomyces sp. NPDC058287]|uniref:hypothetical protein n=1 Tax=Streptomyces sp. NPDC058287 TaxID=3346423 RepID=UPI0036E082A7
MNPTRDQLLNAAAEAIGRYEKRGDDLSFERQRKAIGTARRAGITIGEIAQRRNAITQK